jgi:hypothetical protein
MGGRVEVRWFHVAGRYLPYLCDGLGESLGKVDISFPSKTDNLARSLSGRAIQVHMTDLQFNPNAIPHLELHEIFDNIMIATTSRRDEALTSRKSFSVRTPH